MKKFIFIVLALCAISCSTPIISGYTINGTVTGSVSKKCKVYLSNLSQAESIKDTAEMVDGKFYFEGDVKTPETYFITIDGVKGKLSLFLENSSIKIEATTEDFSSGVITGSKTNDLVLSLKKQKEEISDKYKLDSLVKIYHNPLTPEIDKETALKVLVKAEKEYKKIDSIFIVEHPMSFLSLIMLIDMTDDYTLSDLEKKFDSFKASDIFAENRNLQIFKDLLITLKNLQPGMKAPDLIANDMEGNPVSLSSIYPQNQITMIDFWASWCKPCRELNPALVKIYNTYSKRGFGIISVSLDKQKEEWLKAVQEDKLVWTNISDLKYWNSKAAQLYNINNIPQNIFINQNGIIIKRKASEQEIIKLLEENLPTAEEFSGTMSGSL